jgi:N-acetylglucosaminyldiphosphoundecaprenol N-acetyl-beta-D-mannosaminyltransferase
VRTSFLGVPLDLLSPEELREAVVQAVVSRSPLLHCSLNALKVVEARKDPHLRRSLEQFDLITPDGMSVVWGVRLLGQGIAPHLPGVELMADLLREGSRRGWGFYLLGATPEISASLKSRVESGFPGVRVVGTHHGYFRTPEEPDLVEEIRKSRADVLFVGMPSPRKERFLLENRGALGVPFAMGVGGGLDLLAGKTRPVPLWMRRFGLEWSYRVAQEPRRLAGRYLSTNLRFAALLAGAILFTRRSGRASSC